ncbi:hypothetical protein H4582DRAFT_1456086 [Lactarius indigo]|nr:hypothetical protein H4582DRAFT_1456086 [Lactarius indigo]
MSLESSTRSASITILSPKLPPLSASPSTDASRLSTATTTLSPQAEPFTMTSVLSSPPLAEVQILSPFLTSSPTPADAENRIDSTTEADPSIIEALKSKERLFVLRVGGDMERLINERKGRVEIPTATSYQRLLVHRCSSYYKVIPESDSGSRSIWISFSPESRIPPKRIAELVPVEQTKHPAIKIMSRSVQDRIRAQSQSRTGSVNGEDAESSDVEPSEAGSLGGRSGAPNRLKKALTLEEREAAYNEARSRIFMDFEEKAKEKENDMSASSSTFSLVSGSASTSGGGSSSAGDIDDSISTAPTESEFSGPVARDGKGERRNGSGTNSAGSSRSMHPPKHPSSSRNSRAPSPSVTYASIYEPAPVTVPYDSSQGPPMQLPYSQQPFMYPFSPPPPPPGQGPGQGFMGPMPYYQYSYPQPPQSLSPQHHGLNSDPSGSADPQASGHFVPPPHHSQQMVYMAPYPWMHNPATGAPPASHPGTPSLPHSHSSQYSFVQPSAPQYGGFNVPTFFPSMGPPMHAPSQGQQQPTHPVSMAPLPQNNEFGIRMMPPITMNNDHADLRGRKRGNSRTSGGSLSYASPFGYPPLGGPGVTSPIENGASPVGPRLNSTMRRTSGTSNGSRTPGDEASSVTSSTSSSSRTTSSQHPLPPRPDWAVGLKPNPTLHPTRPPARNGGARNHATSAPPVLLQPADFPPLGGARAPPMPSGVWTSGAGKAREPVGGAHRDAICGEGVERTPSKGMGLAPGPRAPRLASAPPPTHITAPGGDGFTQDLTDGVGALALGREQS